ncbi:hypothetical protein [Oricola cellulosilytica]|uniref:Uncharacterized protein n=1 Tax=Oricola cellulosilytica TaxID=1429082 RepID=A0A4R0PEF0_9HYPH|nr:hypothetical protein [Oricola cellulosilytica]TCD16177.1 hypothetical protein E0D97_01710 [Oricola cellulosilytica]
MQSNRIFTFAEVLPSMLFVAIASYFFGQIAGEAVTVLRGIPSVEKIALVLVLCALAGLGALLWKLPNLAWVRFSYGLLALATGGIIVNGRAMLDASAMTGSGSQISPVGITAVDATIFAAFCILCVWLNVHRWIIWNLRHPRREFQ